ncbi:MAG TPA: glycoside hydrolase [Chloroflexi bacterium]|nr:glycoside hydrolase [Chloroflexota bacterium]
MIKRLFLLFLVATCLFSLVMIYQTQNAGRYAPSLGRVAAWMPTSWDSARARASWDAHRAYIDELSPVWYQLDPSGDGSILPYAGARDATLIAEAHGQSTLVIPLINNASNAGFDAGSVSAVIHDPARRAAHIRVLVEETLTYDYDGIDIDYEGLNGHDDREAFSLFIEELSAALHAQGKLLSIAVHAKTGEPGGWSGPQAQDWTRIGAAVDRFRVMTYDYHWSGGEPGPIAPVWWMEDVIAFAVSVVPPNRVYVGIHFYGRAWGESASTSLTWEGAQDLIAAHDVSPQWKSTETWRLAVAEPWFAYTDVAGAHHTVWYANGASVAARLKLVQKYGLGGVAIWRLGGEDPANWSSISAGLSAN